MRRNIRCSIAVVGGGYTGLWTALRAKERDPRADVVLVEGHRIGWAASGRNGGFCSASLTHGRANGVARFPAELAALERLGQANLDAMQATVERYGIDCEWERTGELAVAVEQWQVDELTDAAAHGGLLLDTAAVRREVDSPTYLAGLWDKESCALVHPAKLAWGLRRVCLELGVRIYEDTPVRSVRRVGDHVELATRTGRIVADRVVLGTNAFPPLVRRMKPYIVPVYDYVLMTEPLSAEQRAAVGWHNRQGIGDSANQFHYYRLTADDRILWGGYDAVYHYGKRVRAAYDQRPETFAMLAAHFFETFPQLAGLRFSHRWGGAIDTCSRFCAFFGTAYGGHVAYAAGFTGLGVGATRFAADVMLDLLGGEPTELTELEMVRSKPLPFPPEPVSYLGIQATRWSLARADRDGGRRNRWLRTLDRLGMGFDS
ncbi:MAG TPA: FAD-dependent oxidoreductase [Mycobacteriales bacterium]|nr:FAD-dependent oxidoreductase [Mycobacteriales bacterium]